MKEIVSSDLATVSLIFKVNQNLPGAPSWSDQQFAEELTKASSIVSRGLMGEVVAFVLARKTPEAFEISYLATDPRVKHKGHMSGLLTRLKGMAEGSKMKIWLEVHEHNLPARRLYEKCGFKETGRRDNYYSDGGSAILYNYG